MLREQPDVACGESAVPLRVDHSLAQQLMFSAKLLSVALHAHLGGNARLRRAKAFVVP